MFHRNSYTNFVKPTEESLVKDILNKKVISGEEVKQLYLQEVSTNSPATATNIVIKSQRKRNIQPIQLSDKDIFLAVEKNDIKTLKAILNQSPDKINLVDSYGWTLLMIACQANSVEVAKELLKRNINTSVRDKAGNSARSLVIKNRNLELCNLLLDYQDTNTDIDIRIRKQMKDKHKPEFYCKICNAKFINKEEHLSSTIHNISSSKGRKFVASYKIPATNRGFQIMVKSGWDRNTGLGRDGSGKIYPIKTEQKKDRKGLGTKKSKLKEKIEDVKVINNKNVIKRLNHESKRKEIDFRREFY